jgi:hypothetical protein
MKTTVAERELVVKQESSAWDMRAYFRLCLQMQGFREGGHVLTHLGARVSQAALLVRWSVIKQLLRAAVGRGVRGRAHAALRMRSGAGVSGSDGERLALGELPDAPVAWSRAVGVGLGGLGGGQRECWRDRPPLAGRRREAQRLTLARGSLGGLQGGWSRAWAGGVWRASMKASQLLVARLSSAR